MNEAAYQAAREGAVYLDRSQSGCVQLSGRDRLDVINRLSTNAVVGLQPGTGAPTVFTNHNGRIIDAVTVLALDAETCWVLTAPDRGPAVAQYLRRNLFFNDQFKVTDMSADISQLHVYGPQATALLERVCGQALHELPLWGHLAADIDGCPVRIQQIRPIHGAGWCVIADVAAVEAVGEMLDEAGAAFLDPDTFQVLRIEHGLPGRAELNLEYIPLEAGLWDAVSFKKGCYVGQEIIARMESRGRMAKKLGGMRLDAATAVPAPLKTAEGADAGVLTSVAYSPEAGHWIGLAYLRPNAEHAPLRAGEVAGEVAPLPFAVNLDVH